MIDFDALTVCDVLADGWQHRPRLLVDLTKNSDIWRAVQQGTPFENVIQAQMKALNAEVSWGRYNEERFIYQDTEHFADRQQNTLHLGVDLGVPAGIAVCAPLEAEVYSVQNNNQQGDYGPTVILKHTTAQGVFHTLYGHLGQNCLSQLRVGQKLQGGEAFAQIGTTQENGGWPPHLHFQIVIDMEGKTGDYSGVANPQNADHFLRNCPDPNRLLRVDLD